jgi:hypothetical protein
MIWALMGMLVSAGAGWGGVDAAGLEAWRVEVSEEAVRWTSVAAAPAHEAGQDAEAERALSAWLARAVPATRGQRQAGRPRMRASGDGGEVWAMEVREGGASVEMAGRRRGGDWQPLYFSATGLPAAPGATFEEAWERVRSVVLRDKTAGVEVAAVRTLAKSGRMRLGTWGGREVDAPWAETWVFQVDDAPLANWAHPCRYVFVAKDLSSVVVRHARTPLVVRETGPSAQNHPENRLEVIVPFDRARQAGIRSIPPPVREEFRIRYDGSVSNCYAVILSGGYDLTNNHIRYWGDAAFIYSTLTLKYGYRKGNVFALISDGLNPASDRSDDTNSPTDLDGDGYFDTFGAATAENVSNLFRNLQASLKPTDQLFVFLTDHGAPTDGAGDWDVELNLWNQEVLRDAELRALTEPIACPVFFAMEQCHSGGFVDDLGQFNRAVATAARHFESSYAGDTYPYYDQWAYHFTAALRGFYPLDETPWLDGEPCDADFNEDGYVSFREAYDYAMIHRFSLDHPTYGENPAGLGKRMFAVIPRREDLGMGELAMDSVPSPQVVHSGFPVRVTAQNVLGDIVSDYPGPVSLRADAPPIDPGEYIGEGMLSWDYPLQTYYTDARTQVIYPPEVMGGARVMDHLALHVDLAPTHPLSHWTVRLKHTPMRSYPEDPVWESEGWTVVVQTNIMSASTGWVTMVFHEPFEYDGVHSLMVDFSFNNEGYADNGLCRASEAEEPVSVTFERDDDEEGPLAWEGRVPPPQPGTRYPNLRFGPPPIPVEVTVMPSNLTGFANGRWEGAVTVMNTNRQVRLRVEDPEHAGWCGDTGWFAVRDYLLAFVSGPIDAATGLLRLEWNSFAGRTYRILEAASLLDEFMVMETGIPADPPKNVLIWPLGWGGTGFYRVEEEQGPAGSNAGSGGSR